MKALFRAFGISPSSHSPTPMPAQQQEQAVLSAPIPASSPFTVVELFQSQSCSSCPPTNANLLHLAFQSSSEDVLFLDYHVEYWNHLNWVDTFSMPAADRRQRDYVRRLGLRSAFTPQVVVNGRASGVGNTMSGLNEIIKEGKSGAGMSMDIKVERNDDVDGKLVSTIFVKVTETSRVGREVEIWVVRYDPRPADVRILSGENKGKTLPHANVVRKIEKLGVVKKDRESVFVLMSEQDGLEGGLLLQDGSGGPIVGAARL